MEPARYEYRPGRFLEVGMTFRASGGPVVHTKTGREVSVGDKGLMQFLGIDVDAVGSVFVVAKTLPTARNRIVKIVRLPVVYSDQSASVVDTVERRPYKIKVVNHEKRARSPKSATPVTHVC